MSEQCTERRALNVVTERCTNGKLRDCETAGPLSPFSAFLTRKETIFLKTSLKISFYRKILVQQQSKQDSRLRRKGTKYTAIYARTSDRAD